MKQGSSQKTTSLLWGVERKYNFRSTYTVETDSENVIEFTGLNLKYVKIVAYFPADTVSKVVGGSVNLLTGYGLLNLYTASGINTSERWLIAEAEKNASGVWDNLWVKGAITKNTRDVASARSYVDFKKPYEDIYYVNVPVTKIVINTTEKGNDIYFPVGTVIEIYGILDD